MEEVAAYAKLQFRGRVGECAFPFGKHNDLRRRLGLSVRNAKRPSTPTQGQAVSPGLQVPMIGPHSGIPVGNSFKGTNLNGEQIASKPAFAAVGARCYVSGALAGCSA